MNTHDERLAFAARLNEALDDYGTPPKGQGRQGTVGKLFGVSQKGARKWLEGEAMPDTKRLPDMARMLRVRWEWLMAGAGPKHELPAIAHPPPGSAIAVWDEVGDLPTDGTYVQVPHYEVAISAGDGCTWVDHPNNDPLVFRARWFQAKGIKPGDCRALYVHGDSMAPILNDGDTVLIDTSKTEVRDDSIYALVYGEELYVKRLFRLPGGGLELRADNPRHPNREVSGADLERVHILGMMVWRAG